MKFRIISNEQTPKVEIIYQDNFISLKGETDIWLARDKKTMLKFLSFARRQNNCVGLAANQVSLDGERIMKRFFAIKVDHFWDIIVEPKIIDYIGSPRIDEEKCLTWIGRKLAVKRYGSISVKYYNLDGEFITRRIDGFEAQIWQHECDHLNGIEEKFI